jgi:hypothetical protein
VFDIPGGHGKAPIDTVYLRADGKQIADFKGARPVRRAVPTKANLL